MLKTGNNALISPTLPLASAQMGLWLMQELQPEANLKISEVLEIRGPIETEVFTDAFYRTVREAGATRLRIVEGAEGPRQLIDDTYNGTLAVLDFSEDEDGVARVWRWVRGQLDSAGPMNRHHLCAASLLKAAQDHYFFYYSVAHIVCDGYSGMLFAQRLASIYTALIEGVEIEESEALSPFESILEAENNYRHSDRFHRDREYWVERLSDLPHSALVSPVGWKRQVGGSAGRIRHRVHLDADMSAALHLRAESEAVSLPQFFVALTAAFLHRTSGQDDFVIGMPVTGRVGRAVRRAMGTARNVLPLRIKLQAHITVEDLIQQVAREVRQSLRHQLYRIEDLRCDLRLAPKQQFFSTCVNVLAFDYQIEFAGAPVRAHNLENGSTNDFDICVFDRGGETGLELIFEANSALCSADEIARYEWRFLELLHNVLHLSDLELARLPILPAGERHQVVEAWNDTAVAYPSESCIQELFEAQVVRDPEATALLFEEQSLSYEELNWRANQLAHHLRELGVRPDDCVALCVERSLEMMVGILGILKAGGAYVPLDPAYPAERLAYILNDSAPVAVLTHGAARVALDAAMTKLSASIVILDLDAAACRDEKPTTNLAVQPLGLTSSHLAYVIYTSGSTGRPKGVMVEHKSVVNQIEALKSCYGLSASDRILQFASFAFDMSVEEMFGGLLSGSVLVLRTDRWLASNEAFLDCCDRFEVTVANLPSSFWEQLIREKLAIPRSIRQIMIGGEAVSQNALAIWFEREGARPRLMNAYGPTEATVNATLLEVGPEAVLQPSIGRPIANTQIYILDENKEPVPIGITGELYIGGAGVARGYLKLPEQTAERFVPSPFVADGKLFRTGDLGRYLPDGSIEFLGRNDFQVKIRGFRIELGDIESRLAEHPGVSEGVIVVRDDGDKRLVAYYTADPEAKVDAESLRAYLGMFLPDYMVPAAFIELESFPLTPNGKLDRKALPVPDGRAYARRGYVAPQGKTEQAIAEIFAEVLGLESVGRNDNFFELGGHSLHAVRLVTRLRQISLETSVGDLFAHPVLKDFASQAHGRRAISFPPNGIVPETQLIQPWMVPLADVSELELSKIVAEVPGGSRNIQDIYSLSPMQEGVLYHHLSSREGDPYLLSELLSLPSRAKLDSFVSALQAVIARHDVLRTAVFWEGLRSPVQVVLREAPLIVEEVEFSAAGEDLAVQLQQRYSYRHSRLDLRVAPLLRLFIAYDEAQDRWLVLILHHHLTLDHVGVELVIEEIGLHLNGRMDALPPPVAYRDYIAQVRLGVNTEEHAAFFGRMLGDIDEPTLPYGLVHAEGDSEQIAESTFLLDEELSHRVRQAARRLGVSAASLYHLAFAQMLGRLSGREDVVFGTVLLGRLQGGEAMERALGMLINTLPVRVSLQGVHVESAARQMQTMLTRLAHHEHASLALAQRMSRVKSPMPLFSGILNYRHTTAGSVEDRSRGGDGLPAGIRLLWAEERANYPFSLSVDDLGKDFFLTAQVNGTERASSVCTYVKQALEGLVTALEEQPGSQLSQISILPPAERSLLLDEWNRTEAEYASERCIHELFEEQATLRPDATAVAFGERRLSYGDLNERANRLAQYLRSLGVRPDDRVGICMKRSPEMVVGLLAVLKSGGAYVPLDPAYPVERLVYMLQDSAPVAVLTHAEARGALGSWAGCPVVDLEADAMTWAEFSAKDQEVDTLSPRHLAYVIYTSGSTGQPKGVMIEHRNAVNFLSWAIHEFSREDLQETLFSTSINFDLSIYECFAPLASGGTIRLVAEIFDLFAKPLDVSLINSVPSALGPLLAARAISSATQTINLAGEPLKQSLVQQIFARSQVARVCNLYGPSETTTYSTWVRMERADGFIAGIGRPIWNTRLYVLDPFGEPVPVGVSGELWIGGAGVARGYLNRPDLTAERFVPSPFVEGDRLYRTGDLVRYRVDGSLEYVGRTDFQVKIRGFRIELGEIEAQLSSHAAVREAAVLAHETPEGDQRLVAYVVSVEPLKEGLVKTLRAYLKGRLPDYMLPSTFISLEALPLTPNGKLDRRALPEPDEAAYPRRDYEPPQGEVERAIAEIFAEVLGRDGIGRHDDFFELGGHSLLAMQSITRLESQFGTRLSLETIFDNPNVAAIAPQIDSALVRRDDGLEDLIENLSDEEVHRMLLEERAE